MVLTGDETRRKEDYAPLARTMDSLLDDPHYRALYTDKEWFDEFVSRSPLASIKRDFPDWEETARGMLNHSFLAEAWGVTTENISLTYDGRRVPFDEAVFGRSMGTEKEFSDAMAQLMRERVTPAEVGARVVRGAVEGTHDVRAGFYDMTAGLLRGERNSYVDLTAHAAGIRVPELERELLAAEQERRQAEHRGALREAVIANGRMESLRREIGIAQAAAQGRVEESFWGSLSRSSEELAREAQSQGEEAHTMFPEVIDPAHDGLWIMRVADSVGQSAPGTAASILNPTFGLSLMYAQTYEAALREYRSVAVERGLDPSDEAADRYAHQQAILQTPFELLGDVAVGQVLKATLRSMPKSPVAGGAKAFGEWIGERARGIAESTAGETLFTTPAQTYGEAYLAEAAGVRDQTTFGQKSLASLDAMSIALGQAGFTSGGPAIAAALVKGAKGDFTAKNLEVPTQYIALDSKGEEATPAAPEPRADSSPGSQPMEANNEDTEPGGQPAPFGVSKEGADVLAFNADPKADWEQAQVVRSTGKEIFGEAGIPQGSKLKGILAVIREWGERTGLYATHRTPALNADVKITKRAIINDLSHWAGNEKVLSVAALPKLLESAVYIQTQRLTNQPGIKQHILAAKLDIGGTPYVVSLVVREREGSLFYDHELIESDKGEPFAGTPIGTNTRGGQQDDSPSVRRVVKEALGVKPKSSNFETQTTVPLDVSEINPDLAQSSEGLPGNLPRGRLDGLTPGPESVQRRLSMGEMFPDIKPEEMVHFSSRENIQNIEKNGVLPNDQGYSHWFRFSEISRFSPDQVSALIGNLAHDDIGIMAVAESDPQNKMFREFGSIPGTDATVTDFEAIEPVPVRTFPFKKSDK